MKHFTIIAVLVALLSAGTPAVSLWAAESLSGRDIADRGSKVSLSGTLVEENGEWSLKTADRIYAVHLGNYTILYPKGINLKDGDSASVSGFLVGEDLSAIKLTSKGATYAFRQEDGTPLWAGRGNNRNEVGANSTGGRGR
jgi:hypothetical protein